MKQQIPFPTAALSAAALTLIAACTVGPDFTRPDAPAGGYQHATPPATAQRRFDSGADVATDWYQIFHSAALEQLVRQALAGNPTLEAARHGLAAAQYELRAVQGSDLPQINATAGIARAHINGSYLYAPTPTVDQTGNQFELGLQFAYNLDLFGGTRRGVEGQRAAAAVTRDQVLNTYVTLVDQTVVTAFDYAATQAQIEVTQSLVAELQSQYELTHTLENAGKIIRSDTLQAQAQLENLRATLPGLEQQRDIYRNALAQLTGSTPDEFAMPVLSLKDFTVPQQLPLSVPSKLVRQRPPILAAEDALHQASAAVGVATAARFPNLTLSGQYAHQTSEMSDFLTSPGATWEAGVGLTQPLFHGGALKAHQQEAEERYAQAQASYRGAVIGAFVEVADALQALQHDTVSYDAHQVAFGAARDDRDLSLEQYRAGKYTELQVLTAEQQYQQAALTQVQADVQRFTDTAALFRALGGGWWNAPRDPAALAAANGDLK